MITKPKARKFRIRRSDGPETSPAAAAVRIGHMLQGSNAGARPAQIASDRPPLGSPGIDDIRREGLTGRQLRMARRLAQKNGLNPNSDFDAVRLLRARGIDPFERGGLLQIVASDVSQEADPALRVHLPQTLPAERPMMPPPSTRSPADRRAEEIMQIQRDIARRRRRKLAFLFSRLAAFVLLPTLLVGYYYYAVATPMYASKSAFQILSADGGMGGVGGLFQGTSFATGPDSIATQEYLESKDAMLRLDQELGLRAHFSQPWIDPLQRLDPDASNEAVYKLYRKYVHLGYDPTEGVIRMEVATADPAVSSEFSQRLIRYAEERVDELSRKKREDALRTADHSLERAKDERRAAQAQLVALQEDSILDPEGEIAGIRSLIGSVELQLQEKHLALNIQQNNARPNAARVTALQSEVAILEAELEKQKARLTEATAGEASLASKTAAVQMAQADLATADLVLQSALEAKRQAEIEANKQVRYLSLSVRPVASQDATYPRAFENTLLAFLIFSGIYLMISLTASILREQVSS